MTRPRAIVRIPLFLALWLGASASTGCGAPGDTAASPPLEQEPLSIIDTSPSPVGDPWTITWSAFLPDMPTGMTARVTLTAEEVRFEAPCNIYTTKVQVENGRMVVFPFENMPRICRREAMEAESSLLRALTRVATYVVTAGDELTLSAVDDSPMIRAVR